MVVVLSAAAAAVDVVVVVLEMRSYTKAVQKQDLGRVFWYWLSLFEVSSENPNLHSRSRSLVSQSST